MNYIYNALTSSTILSLRNLGLSVHLILAILGSYRTVMLENESPICKRGSLISPQLLSLTPKPMKQNGFQTYVLWCHLCCVTSWTSLVQPTYLGRGSYEQSLPLNGEQKALTSISMKVMSMSNDLTYLGKGTI